MLLLDWLISIVLSSSLLILSSVIFILLLSSSSAFFYFGVTFFSTIVSILVLFPMFYFSGEFPTFSKIFAIAHGNIFMTAALKSLCDDSNTRCILVLVSVGHLFSFK